MDTALTDTKYAMPAAVAHQIWNYIGMLGVDRETARDLYQEAEDAVWEAATLRAYDDNHSFLAKTGIGVIRHWLRDHYSLIRIPGYLYDRGEAAQHVKTMLPLDEITERVGYCFESSLIEQLSKENQIRQIRNLLPRLTRAERQVMEALLLGKSIQEITKERDVHSKCIYTQRNKAVAKLRKLLEIKEPPRKVRLSLSVE